MTNAVWVEKYRPQSIDEVAGHPDIKATMKSFLENESLPHCIFEGPAGTGKTTIAHAFADELYGEYKQGNYLELNASDKRGIDVVRNDIKSFASQSPVGDHSFKIIFLDEIDSTTDENQAALRRVIEKYTEINRFIVSCNYVGNLIEPIQSRLIPFHFSPLEDDDVRSRLKYIMEEEGFDLSDEKLDKIVDLSEGDMRTAVNSLQKTYHHPEHKVKLATAVNRQKIKDILNQALQGEVGKGIEIMNEIVNTGVSGDAICSELLSAVKRLDNISAQQKMNMITAISTAEWRIMNGANKDIQTHDLVAKLFLAVHE